MAEKQTKTISINGTEYTEDQLTDQQKVMINHVADLIVKLDQLSLIWTNCKSASKPLWTC